MLKTRGMTLIEVLSTLSVMAMAMMVMVSMVVGGSKSNTLAQEQMVAGRSAERVMESIKEISDNCYDFVPAMFSPRGNDNSAAINALKTSSAYQAQLSGLNESLTRKEILSIMIPSGFCGYNSDPTKEPEVASLDFAWTYVPEGGSPMTLGTDRFAVGGLESIDNGGALIPQGTVYITNANDTGGRYMQEVENELAWGSPIAPWGMGVDLNGNGFIGDVGVSINLDGEASGDVFDLDGSLVLLQTMPLIVTIQWRCMGQPVRETFLGSLGRP